ncbi:MAG TPA: hypothetical protein VF407_09685 [Polyangiaceae bacterium]
MKLLACALALSVAACASSSPPPPKTAQQEEPIRTQDEIARDQASTSTADSTNWGSSGSPDAETCRKHPNVPGCPGVPKRGPLDNTTTRSPRLVNAR